MLKLPFQLFFSPTNEVHQDAVVSVQKPTYSPPLPHAYVREATAEPRKADTNPVSQCDNMGLPQI